MADKIAYVHLQNPITGEATKETVQAAQFQLGGNGELVFGDASGDLRAMYNARHWVKLEMSALQPAGNA
jgi:hypothetical protein